MEPTDTSSSPQPAISTPAMPPVPAVEPSRSYVWMVIVVVVIAAAAALYWFMVIQSPVPQEPMPTTTETQLSADADAVAAEINALSTDGLDAELDQIDKELAQ